MTYRLEFSAKAQRDLQAWKRSGQVKMLKKIMTLLQELTEHPTSGTGQVEQLKGDFSGYWSRRIDKESRLVYSIEDDAVIVSVISMRGHYSDK